MARPTSKARLENGLKLDINRLAHLGIVRRGSVTKARTLVWTSSYWGETARAAISADTTSQWEGSLRVQLGSLDQRLRLRAHQRHFGGVQWYFVCPATGRSASVLWMPPGANRFSSRQTWGRSVAYTSQCLSQTDRAWRMMEKIKMRLIADLDPEEWHFPPKPKGMRWRTYRRYEAWFDRWDAWLDHGACSAAARLMRVWNNSV